jgi:sulfur-carrier protein
MRRTKGMSVTVRIPGPLRRITNGADKVQVDGSDLSGLITSLESQFPGMKERLLDENGELRYFVNLYLNNEDIRFLEGLKTSVKSGDEVSIVPAVAGGC